MTARTLALALGLLVGVAGCSKAATPTRTPEATNTTNASISSYRLAPCADRQLTWKAWSNHPGDTQDLGALLIVTNTSDQPCSLSGRPTATATLSTGDSIPAVNDPAGASLPPDAGHTLTLRAGGTAYLRFRDPSECAAGANHGPPSFTAIQLRFDGASVHIPLSGLTVPASCGFALDESPFYQ
jgi:hypothetical protein